jgi:hypothetical protein
MSVVAARHHTTRRARESAESDPHVSKPTFRVESEKSLFAKPQSAVFTVKSDICLWAGQNRAQKAGLWRAITFQGLGMAKK